MFCVHVNSPPSSICQTEDFWHVYFVIQKLVHFQKHVLWYQDTRCIFKLCGAIMKTDLTLKSSVARRALSICRTRRELSKVASNTCRQNKAHISANKTCFWRPFSFFFHFSSSTKDTICQLVLITAFLEWGSDAQFNELITQNQILNYTLF